MSQPKIPDEVLIQAVTLRKQFTTLEVAEQMGVSPRTVRRYFANAEERLDLTTLRPWVTGVVEVKKTHKRPLPKKGQVARYLVTSAQNNTYVHEEFFNNLLAFSEHLDAELMISQFSYNKASYGQKAVKPGTGPTADDVANLWFDDEMTEYAYNDRVQLAPGLIFCGNMNILPTASRPLSGMDSYTKRESGIFPHAKMAMESVPSMHETGVKFNYTTGSCTLRNYIQKKAGIRAEFHHTYGALLVEVDTKGSWWVRQINATDNGDFYDLDRYIKDGEVTEGHRLEAINWGDVHVECLHPGISELNWGEKGILDVLKPKQQFLHDTVDFRAKNHHEIRDPHKNFEKWITGRYTVKEEFERVKEFLDYSSRPWCKSIVVDSNHDSALERWLRETDYKQDPPNALFFLRAQLAKYEAIEKQEDNFHLVEHILQGLGADKKIRFLRQDESYVICRSIECGMHGHLGANGTRATPLGLSRLGRKSNTGHTHSAKIIDGLYVAGTSTLLRVGYNKGPSSWSHTHVLTYPNGKRTLISIWDDKWRA